MGLSVTPLPLGPPPSFKTSFFTPPRPFVLIYISKPQRNSITFALIISSHLNISYHLKLFTYSYLIPLPSPSLVSMWSQRSQYTSILSTPHRTYIVYLSSPHPRRVSSCHVISSCQCVILHMSSCHVSTCHDIVSYHIHYHYVFTFVT